MAELKEGGLTGARRFRREGYSQDQTEHLILQVQYNTWVSGEVKPSGMWKTLWRDATSEDITSAEEVV